MLPVQDTAKLLEHIAQELSSPEVVFPTCFDVTTRMHHLLKDPDVSLDRLAAAMATDPLLSTRVIQLANSVAIRGSGPEVGDLKTATLRIGLEMVRSMTYAIAVEQLVRSKHMAQFKETSQRIWEHSLLVAAIARRLAQQVRMNPDRAFFLGMVHDIGAFYLLFRCSTDEEVHPEPDEFFKLVNEWHDGIGHALLTALGQDEEVCEAVQEHESIRRITNLHQWNELLCLADWLARQHNDWPRPEIAPPYPLAIPDGVLAPEAQQELLEQGVEEAKELRAVLF